MIIYFVTLFLYSPISPRRFLITSLSSCQRRSLRLSASCRGGKSFTSWSDRLSLICLLAPLASCWLFPRPRCFCLGIPIFVFSRSYTRLLAPASLRTWCLPPPFPSSCRASGFVILFLSFAFLFSPCVLSHRPPFCSSSLCLEAASSLGPGSVLVTCVLVSALLAVFALRAVLLWSCLSHITRADFHGADIILLEYVSLLRRPLDSVLADSPLLTLTSTLRPPVCLRFGFLPFSVPNCALLSPGDAHPLLPTARSCRLYCAFSSV